MTQEKSNTKHLLLLLPIIGILLFILLYIIATFLYPGGSQADKNAVGFSWTNNYWCNLLNENGINGQPNPAKPVAITGMFILCLALSLAWFLFPRYMNITYKLKITIRVSGILSMIVAFFLYTNFNHDLIINIASALGVIAVIGTLVALYKSKLYTLFAFGIINILLVGANNYFYNTKGLIVYLPVVQKISFASFLIWFCCINLMICYELRKPPHN